MKPITYPFFLLIICSFSNCKFGKYDKSNQSKDTLTVDNFEIKKGKTLAINGWACSVVKKDVICYPSKWKPVEQNKVYFFAYLDNDDKNTFFTIVNYNIASDKINAVQYLKAGYAQLMADTTEKFSGYTVKELIFKDKKSYYAEYYTIIDGKQYLAYSTLFERNGLLYDVDLKVKKNKSLDYRQIFSNILFNLRIDGILLFDEKDKLEKIHIVDLSKL